MAVIGACTAFGAICGSSVATTATFGRAALPELRRYRYDGGFATGTIAVGGTLGILIPPSVILVVYAITTEQNIAKAFSGGADSRPDGGVFLLHRHCARGAPEPRSRAGRARAGRTASARKPGWMRGLAILLLAGTVALWFAARSSSRCWFSVAFSRW